MKHPKRAPDLSVANRRKPARFRRLHVLIEIRPNRPNEKYVGKAIDDIARSGSPLTEFGIDLL
jgi:hypothetical protein